MRSRRPLYGVVMLFFVNGAALGSWLPRLPELRDRLGLGLGALGLTLAMSGIGGLLGSALSGWLVGRAGARRVALWPAMALMVALPAIGFAPTAIFLGVAIFLAAIVDALADVGMNALAVRAQQARGRSIFTRLHALWSLGSLSGAAVSTAAVTAGIPLTVQLTGMAVVGAAAVNWAARVIPHTDLRPRVRSRAGLTLSIMVAGAAVALVEGVPHDWSAIYLTDVLRASPAVAGSGFLCLSAGMVIGRMAGDRLVDRAGAPRSIYFGLAVVATATAVVVLSPVVVLALIAFTAWGLGISVVLPLLYRLAGSHHAFGEGSGLAALTVGSRLGFMAGPTAVGSTAALTSLPTGVAIPVGLALALAAVILSVGISE